MGGFSLQLIFIATLVLLAAAGGVVSLLLYRQRRERRDVEHLGEMQKVGLHLPPSLHPVIDPEICIGSLACLKACPEGEILGLVDGAARLIHGAKCIGHGRCADECPVDAIRLVFGTSERGIDLPQLGAHFESTRAGIHIVGELGGMGLIKNAIRQGVEVGEHLGRALAGGDGQRNDVVIVGAGPAGIGAAMALKQAGLSFVLLDQDSLGGTVAHYPRQKLVMTETVQVPGFGRFGRAQMRKEEVIESFEKILARGGVQVREGVRVDAIGGTKGAFELETTQGRVEARAVVLAIGRRGSPRKLGAKGEELPKVTYRLIDPTQYGGKRVLVVGGGDSALESAIMLAGESDAEVAISYRREAFGRCRPENKKRIDALIDAGRVVPFMGSTVTSIEDAHLTLAMGERELCLANDFVIVNVGGELPTAFLQASGIEIQTHHGKEAGDAPEPDAQRASRRIRRLEFALFTLGAAITALLAVAGWEYYLLPEALRDTSPLHAALRPTGWWGHGVGVIATAVMLLNFVYAARKRWGFMRRLGSIRTWLSFHLFVGFLSPVVIVFHAAFKSNNLLATVTLASLLVVVTTGILGRFIWGMIPSNRDETVEASPGQLDAARKLRRLLTAWRAFHVALAVLMVLVIAAHVAVSLMLGFGWILF